VHWNGYGIINCHLVHGIEHHKNTHHTNKKKIIFTLIDTRREDNVF